MNGSWKRNKKVEGHMKVHNLFSTGTSNILIAWGQGFMAVNQPILNMKTTHQNIIFSYVKWKILFLPKRGKIYSTPVSMVSGMYYTMLTRDVEDLYTQLPEAQT